MTQLSYPEGVFVSNDEVFIADTLNHRVRKLLRNGQIVTIAGTGVKGYDGDGQLATNAKLRYPTSVVVSSSDQVYISDGNRIRKIDRNGIISTIAGNGESGYNGDDQLAIYAKMSPYGLFVTEDEEILIADNDNHRVRKIDRFGIITTIAGNENEGYNGDDQLATTAQLFHPLSVFQYKHEIYIVDYSNHRIRKINPSGIISTIAGPYGVNPDKIFVHHDEVYFTQRGTLCKLQCNGILKTLTESEVFNCPNGLFVDNDSQIYIADTFNHCIRRVDQDGVVSSIVGKMGEEGYSGDVPFDFQKYPHIGPRQKPKIKPVPKSYLDIHIHCQVKL